MLMTTRRLLPLAYDKDLQELHLIWSDIAEIRSIAVDPDAQTAGIGRAMAERLFEIALELGVPKVHCFT